MVPAGERTMKIIAQFVDISVDALLVTGVDSELINSRQPSDKKVGHSPVLVEPAKRVRFTEIGSNERGSSAPKSKSAGAVKAQRKQEKSSPGVCMTPGSEAANIVERPIKCRLLKHSHSLGSCPEFFYLSPEERVKLVRGRSICRTCPGPARRCLRGWSKCHKRVPKTLLCFGCLRNNGRNKQAPGNVLFCTNRTVEHSKPTVDKFIDALRLNLGDWSLEIESRLITISIAGVVFESPSCELYPGSLETSTDLTTSPSEQEDGSSFPMSSTETGVAIKEEEEGRLY